MSVALTVSRQVVGLATLEAGRKEGGGKAVVSPLCRHHGVWVCPYQQLVVHLEQMTCFGCGCFT